MDKKLNIVAISDLKIGDCFRKINTSYKDDNNYIVTKILENIVRFVAEDGHVEFGVPKKRYFVEKL